MTISLLKQKVRVFEKEVLVEYLDKNRWHRTNTARELGITRASLHNKMKLYEILKSDRG